MGCGLRKMKPVSEENSPGKIYSTLKRPQVETKVGVAYTYRYLDFLIGKDGGTSTLRLSSVRELPGQLQELYQQGFVLAAVHPFIHPCGPESNSPQHQLYRAILVRLSEGVDSRQPVCAPFKLQLEECLSAEQVPTPELIQGYVKKIQDAADQGVMFVGFVQEPYGAPCTRIREADTPSLSLHSSPSSVLGSLGSRSPPDPSSPRIGAEPEPEGGGGGAADDRASPASPVTSTLSDGDAQDESCHNNNKDRDAETNQRPGVRVRGDGAELLALYNHPPVREAQVKYYTVKVPLRVQNCDEGVKGVEANWLDHMTQHFNNGASLVDGYFHLGNVNDLLPKSVESVFIFQEAGEGEPSAAAPTYDAIVVEQWTVIDGLQVKADYIPLLQSLATYGWRLTCVLPTPVIKTNSDGSLSTKQIVFLQRPVLSRKRRESKKLIFKPRGKSNKNCIKDTARNKKKKKTEESRNRGGREAASEAPKEDEGTRRDDAKTDDGIEVEPVAVVKKEAETKEETGESDGGKDAAAEGSEENGEPLENGEVEEESTAGVEGQSDTKENRDEGAEEVQAVIENGVESDETGEPQDADVAAE